MWHLVYSDPNEIRREIPLGLTSPGDGDRAEEIARKQLADIQSRQGKVRLPKLIWEKSLNAAAIPST